jgi:hypothetical protein
MARPIKKGLDYFPQDIDIHSDRKIRRLLLRYSSLGYLIYEYIKCQCYKENGYWLLYDCEYCTDIIYNLNLKVDCDAVNEIVMFCIEISLFDKEIYEKHNVLTSIGIQKRYFEAKRRKTQLKDFCLIRDFINELLIIATKTPVIETETKVIETKTKVNDETSTQSKVKESKVNNTYYNDDERKESAERKTTKPEFENAVKNFVNATANESESLNKHLKFDEVIVEDFCENWLTSNEFSNQREQLMIKHYIQTPENLKDWIYAFNRHLLIHGDNFTHDGKVIKTKRDYAKHFSNWMDKTKRGDVNPNELNIAKKPQAQKPKTNLAGIPIHDSGLVDGNELLKNLIDKGVVKRGR